MKFCKDCKWYGPGSRLPAACLNLKVLDEVNPVSGLRKHYSAASVRADDGPCGPAAELFEPRPTLFQRLASLFR